MRTKYFALPLFFLFLSSAVVLAQTTGSISGKVEDVNGALVPNAKIVVRGPGGQEFTAVTSDSGTYRIPAVGNGIYTVTITANGFKSAVVNEVKVDVGTPATVNAKLEIGDVSQVVEVVGGAEVLQTQSATVGTNMTGRQIIETPIQSRDALDLIVNLPGTNTIGTVRTSTINGLPKSALSVSIDGIDANTSLLKASDGFFTFIRPRIDAIDEVTVSTSNPGVDSSGDSAAQVKFVTRRGTNDYHGGLYWQHRNDSLNANNWLNNRDGLPVQKIKLHQYGGKFGGPIPFFTFGESDHLFDSGKDKRFFFVNYEEYRIPEASPTRTRTLLEQDAMNGVFQYVTGGVTNSVDLYALAASKGFTSTPDPTVQAMMNQIRASTSVKGTLAKITNSAGVVTDFNRERLSFTNLSNSVRKFFTNRLDFNLNRNHSLETVFNYDQFRGDFDLLNNADPSFPGFTNGGAQNSDRYMFSTALRSNFGSNVVNEFRFGKLWGNSGFALVGGEDWWANNLGGYALTFNVTGLATALTNPTSRNSSQIRKEPTSDFQNNLTWLKGAHSITFGGQYKQARLLDDNFQRIVPTVSFTVSADDDILNLNNEPVPGMFNTTNFPNASATQLADAAAIYALLTGRVSGYTDDVFLSGDGKYIPHGSLFQEVKHVTYGVYAQDMWRISPNLTLTFGLRWQPQQGYTLITENYARLTDPNMVYDVSGPGNIFAPGTTTGVIPTVTGTKSGERAFDTDMNNFAPSFGVVWSPNTSENGFLRKLLGESGKSVFRGGWSRSFIREGLNLPASVFGNNPGGTFSVARSNALGNLVSLGSLLRTPGNPNLTPAPFVDTPSYPRTLTTADSAFAFDSNLKTGYVDSFSVGYQREIGKDTVVEVRYVGNRGKDIWRLYTLNQVNAIENGFGQEFVNAQNNLYLNKAAGRGNTFRYFSDVAGSVQLPIFQSFYTGSSTSADYSNGQYTNAANVLSLSRNNPTPLFLAATLTSTLARRNNGIAAGRAPNFINNCPTTLGFCFIMDNSERSWYDSGVIEVRRRMSAGLRFQASYVFAKAFTNSFVGATTAGGFAAFTAAGADQSSSATVTLRNPDLDKSFAQIDIRHAFKFDATYDLPFGTGQKFMSDANWFTNALFGGWSFVPTLRWQSGSPFSLENVQLVGMTVQELQKEIKANKGASRVTYLPDDIITNTKAAFNPDPTQATGYSSAFGVPTGRFIAPAGYGNCIPRFDGECGFRRLTLYGPGFFKVDASVIKRIGLGERRNVELRATFFDVLNRTNWRIGGWTGNFTNVTNMNAATFGELGTGTSYQDPFGSNDPGGRIVDLIIRINF